ncbi:MAG: PH domain-containing protein [Clostridia bacterium]|nr:PH domain-containing protein [Clostridia bacterium]
MTEARTYSEGSNAGGVLKERKRWGLFGLPFTFTVYRLDPKTLVIKTGLFTTTENEIRLYRVLDVSMTRSFGQKMFGMGSLKVISSDKTTPDLTIKNIKNVRRFKEYLSEYVELERKRNRMRANEIIDHYHDDNEDDDLFDDDRLY